MQPIHYSSTDQFKKFTTTKRIWIFGDSLAAREGYDQHLGAHISQQGHDLYKISDNYKEGKKLCVLTGLESLLLLKYKISETISIHILITPSSPASQLVPSQASYSKSSSSGSSSEKILKHQFLWHCPYFQLFNLLNTFIQVCSRREGLSSTLGFNPLSKLLQFSNSAFFSSIFSMSPRKIRPVVCSREVLLANLWDTEI